MAVLLTLLHVLIDEGLTDERYLAERTVAGGKRCAPR